MLPSTVIDWVTYALDAPSARAVVFGFNIRGNLLCSVLKFPSCFLFMDDYQLDYG
jgi:hypothetical protein